MNRKNVSFVSRVPGRTDHKIFPPLLAIFLFSLLLLEVIPTSPGVFAEEKKLLLCATTPDLKSITEWIGGERVEVISIVRGPEDPHFVEVRPSILRILNRCDLYLQVGLELEVGWAPALLNNARNPRILPGAEGFLSLEEGIVPLEVPLVVDRRAGDVHPRGNPHYLLDPLNGALVADRIASKLISLDPEGKESYERNRKAFLKALLKALLGEELVNRYGEEKLYEILKGEDLQGWLEREKALPLLKGWLGLLAPYEKAPIVSDHNLWSYFARRFSLRVVAVLEPKPGIDPSTAHLKEVSEIIRREGVRVLLSAPYFDPRFARSVAETTGVKILPMAHQTGARPPAKDYLSMLDYNVHLLADLLGEGPSGKGGVN